jgi:hypothetical protein
MKLRPTRYLLLDEAAALVAELDGDGDGRLSLEEFAAWWRGGGSLTPVEQFDRQWAAFGAKCNLGTGGPCCRSIIPHCSISERGKKPCGSI